MDASSSSTTTSSSSSLGVGGGEEGGRVFVGTVYLDLRARTGKVGGAGVYNV